MADTPLPETMLDAAQSGVLPAPELGKKEDGPEEVNKKIATTFKSEAERSRTHRKNLIPKWKRNVDARLGNPTVSSSDVTDEDAQSTINPDWSLTKTKTANLYSQVPTVQGTTENTQFKAAVPPFVKSLNYEIGLKRSKAAVSMEEVLNDVVNASGIGAIYVSYEALFIMKKIPLPDVSSLPPELVQEGIEKGLIPTRDVPFPADYRFPWRRISPANLLWPKGFKGSDFNDADWQGYDGDTSWAEAKNLFDLKDADKEALTGGQAKSGSDKLQSNGESGLFDDLNTVHYTHIFYWRHRVDPEEKSFSTIWEIVWIDGKTEPVLHRPWKGQKYDPKTYKYVGSCIPPLQFLTVTYVSDNAVPPSDTAAGRPQVQDLQKSRSQMFMNRDRSRPMRWYDVNRVDPEIGATIMRGTWQGAIPTNGPGDRVVGEVARASYPSEDLTFDQQTKADLMESWQVGPNQMATTAGGGTTKGEAELVQANFSTRIGQERGRVADLFLRCVQVHSGLMALYSDFPDLTKGERDAMVQVWDMKKVPHEVAFKIRPDSQVVQDSTQRSARIAEFVNLWAKSGLINLMPLAAEAAELIGIDPSEVLKQPEPQKPEDPTISFRLTGKDDLQSPIVLALLVERNLAPSPKSLEIAKQILSQNLQPPQPPPPPGPPQGPGGPPPPPGAVPPDHNEHPEWNLQSKIAQRSEDMGQGG